MPAPYGIRVGRCLQAFGRILAHGLEHSEARAVANYQAVVDETGEGVEYFTVGYRLARLDGPSRVEHRQLPEQPLLLGVEEVVAPGEHRPQGAVALGRVPPACGQKLEPIADPIENLRN